MLGFPLLIFDFDGVIAQTLKFAIQIGNQLAREMGFERQNDTDTEKLRGMNTLEIFRTLGIPLLKVPLVAKRIREGLRAKIHLAEPVPGIRNSLKTLHQRGFKMGILTSNSKENVKKFLKKNNLEFFDFIHSRVEIFGKDWAIRKLLKTKGLKKEEVVYIGDETRDIEGAKKAGVKIIAVSWGYNTADALKKERPDYLINKPSELPGILENL